MRLCVLQVNFEEKEKELFEMVGPPCRYFGDSQNNYSTFE